MKTPRLLIVDDETKLVSSLIYGLRISGIEATGAYTAAQGLEAAAADRPDLVLLDLRLPDRSGIEVLQELKARDPSLPVAVISAHGDIRVAVEAIKLGALDFVTKPFNLDDIVALARGALAGGAAPRPAGKAAGPARGADEFIGLGSSVLELREQVQLVARSSARIILLLGESGTGKGLVSRLLHTMSARAGKPFVTTNCAALPDTLMEAELFGAERGAYTGAHQRRAGLVEIAEGGTFLLDEIGELALPLQAKLLHFLENRAFRPIGSSRERQADVRVIAATNRDLAAEVEAGRFRADLYYRLNVVPIALPRLADRPEDVPALAEHFSRRAAEEEGAGPLSFDAEAVRMLCAYQWPGNVRELKHLVERLTILHPGECVTPAMLPPEMRGGDLAPSPAVHADIDALLAHAERDILVRALRAAGGRKSKAAEDLGISRHALKRRLQRLRLAGYAGIP